MKGGIFKTLSRANSAPAGIKHPGKVKQTTSNWPPAIPGRDEIDNHSDSLKDNTQRKTSNPMPVENFAYRPQLISSSDSGDVKIMAYSYNPEKIARSTTPIHDYRSSDSEIPNPESTNNADQANQEDTNDLVANYISEGQIFPFDEDQPTSNTTSSTSSEEEKTPPKIRKNTPKQIVPAPIEEGIIFYSSSEDASEDEEISTQTKLYNAMEIIGLNANSKQQNQNSLLGDAEQNNAPHNDSFFESSDSFEGIFPMDH